MRALVLAALISISEVERANCGSKMHGIFNLSIPKNSIDSPCHECLVKYLGATQLNLLEVNDDFRLYWAVGYTDIAQRFIKQCNTENKCIVSEELQQNYIPQYPSGGQQQFEAPANLHAFEYNIHNFANLITGTIISRRAFIPEAYSRQRKHEVSSFTRKQLPEISVFFADKWNENEPRKSVENYYIFDSLMQCIVVPSLRQDGTCKECLAMHSKSSTIRAYFFYHKSATLSGELFMFPSDHVASIIKNCEQVFCFQLFALEPRECNDWEHFFKKLHHVSKSSKLTHGQSSQYRNFADANEESEVLRNEEIKKVMEHIGLIRMPRHCEDNEARKAIAAYIIPPSPEDICFIITARPLTRMKCISCVLKKENIARLVVFLSLSNALVLTKRKSIGKCARCTAVKELSADACRNILDGPVMKTETYEHPSKLHLLNGLGKNCIVSYHQSTRQDKCFQCMKSVLGVDVKPYIIMKTSILLRTLKSDSKLKTASYEELLQCRNSKDCTRIQLVPYKFCSVHQSFQVLDSAKSAAQSKANKFSPDRIQVGIWPPQKHRIVPNVDFRLFQASSLSHSQSGYDIEMWPTYNTIAVVEFTYAKFKEFDCVKCLVQLSEVFLAYTALDSRYGYVWMRQSSSALLKLCVGVHCLSLFYDETREQIERPVGLRRLTSKEI
uniref:CHXC9 n=1 Tax=Albugo laibachii Nc14 TaxID=890382 RepID=F0X246_9STRA|nr:CHXC9 [Albugo laibachii Nc14]|eukprot:CCA27918.1 CHXC9 [Albugo laibachii Nc14]